MEEKTIDKSQIEKVQKEYDDHKASLENKQYAVASSDAHLLALIIFFENDAKWTGMEALGVTQVLQKLKKIKDNGLHSGFMYLRKLELDAISFFHSSASGKGYSSAENFIFMIKPFNEPLKEAKADIDKLNQLEMKLAAVMNGIDIEEEVAKLEQPQEDFDKN